MSLEGSLDNLVGEGVFNVFDKKTLLQLQELKHLEENKKRTLFDLVDTYIRDEMLRPERLMLFETLKSGARLGFSATNN